MTAEEREEKIKKYAYLVHNVVNRFLTRLPPELGSEREDLINVGIIGLINAVDRFQAEKSTSFEAYATIRIKGAILDELRSRDYMNRGARERRKLAEKAMRDMERKLGRLPEAEEIAEYLGMDLEEYYRLLDDSKSIMLIYEDELPENLEGGYNDEEIYEAVDNENPFSILADREMKKRLIEAIEKLPEQERLVLSLYYNEELTMKEIGKVLSLTESRVSQIHTQAIMRLRAMIHEGKKRVRKVKVPEKPVRGHHVIA